MDITAIRQWQRPESTQMKSNNITEALLAEGFVFPKNQRETNRCFPERYLAGSGGSVSAAQNGCP